MIDRPKRVPPSRGLAAVAAVLLLSGAAALRSQTPPQAAPAAGTPTDGKIFRILDRITREVDKLVLFRGRIPRAIAVGRSPTGAFTLCMNCTDDKAAPKPEAASKPDTAPKLDAAPKSDAVPKPETAPAAALAAGSQGTGGAAQKPADPVGASPGDLLVCDLTAMWNLRLEDGAFVFTNDDGYDADDREYGAYPTAGADTSASRLGSLLFVSNRSATGSCPFQVAIRYWGTTYLAPIAGCDRPPSKPAAGDAGLGDLRDLTRSHLERPPDWATRYRTAFVYRDGAAANPLTAALGLLAAGPDEFLAAIDLRKLESAQSSYFWMTQRPHRSIRLDQNTVTVEGSGEPPDGYEPVTYVEYPYLIVLGSYAKVRLAPNGGGPETVLTLGFCDECP